MDQQSLFQLLAGRGMQGAPAQSQSGVAPAPMAPVAGSPPATGFPLAKALQPGDISPEQQAQWEAIRQKMSENADKAAGRPVPMGPPKPMADASPSPSPAPTILDSIGNPFGPVKQDMKRV